MKKQIILTTLLCFACSPETQEEGFDPNTGQGNVIGEPGTGIGGGLVELDQDELENTPNPPASPARYGVYPRDTEVYSDEMMIDDNEKLRISYKSFIAMKLDPEMIEADCDYKFGDSQNVSQIIRYESKQGPVSLQAQYTGKKTKLCFVVNGIDESEAFNYQHPAMFTDYGEMITITNQAYPPELDIFEKVKLITPDPQTNDSYALFSEAKTLFSTYLEPEKDQKLRITKESFDDIFDDIIMGDCGYGFGPEAQLITYVSDYGPVSLKVLYGNSGEKTILCFKVNSVDKTEEFGFYNPAMFTAFGEQISTSREEYSADVEVFREVKLLTDNDGYIYGLISSDDSDSYGEMISKISKQSYVDLFKGQIISGCSRAFSGGYQEVSYLSDWGPVNLKVLYVTNDEDPSAGPNSQTCFKVAGQDETDKLSFDHPALFTAPGEPVDFRLSQYEADLDLFKKVEIIEDE